MQENPTFHIRLKQLTSEFGDLNPSELAEQINLRFPESNLARNTPNTWLTRTPTWDYIIKIATVFEVSTDWLSGRLGAQRDSPHAQSVFQKLLVLLADMPGVSGLTPTERLAKAIQLLQSIDHRSVGSDWMVMNRLGMSLDLLHDVLTERVELRDETYFVRFAEFTGVPVRWIATGETASLTPHHVEREFLAFFAEMKAAGITGAALIKHALWLIRTLRHFADL